MSKSRIKTAVFETDREFPVDNETASGAYIASARRGQPETAGYEAVAEIEDCEQEARYSITVDGPVEQAMDDIVNQLGTPDRAARYAGATHLDYDDAGIGLSLRGRNGTTQVNAHTPAFSAETARDVKTAAYQEARQAS